MTRLVILSLLQQHPMHGYEIQQTIQEQKMEQWTNILSGSIYFALNQMEKEGLVRADAEERTGNRLRKIYAITDQGREAFLELLREALTSPPHSLKSDFSLALGLAMVLSQEERNRLLLQNIKNLGKTREFWKAGQEIKGRLHPALQAHFANDLELIERDLRFLRELLVINESVAGQGRMPARNKATHLVFRTTGDYNGNSFTYKETVPVAQYKDSYWWQRFRSEQAEEVLARASEILEMDCFMIDDSQTKTITEIIAIHQQ
jgi:DNA-binding PadR family transcriptional regulator